MADKCTPVRSSWLTHVGTFGGKLFVAFKNGVCCLYPNTDDSYYQLALAYASKGHYVHQWLFKLLPYILIKNPCPGILAGVATGCCADAIPRMLHASFTGGSGTCDGSYPLPYNPATQRWHYESGIGTCPGGGEGDNLSLTCTLGNWSLLFNAVPCVQTALSCSPFSVQFAAPGSCGCGTASIVVTP